MRAQQTDRIARQGVHLAASAFEAIGFAFREQHQSDYGIDAHVELIDGDRPTGRLLGVQVKAGKSYLSETIGDNFVFRADAKHVDYWVDHALPVLVCLADLDNDIVYWQLIDSDTAESTGTDFRVMVPKDQVIDDKSLSALRDVLTMVVPQDRYTLLKTNDVSHGTAKRYSFKAVLNGTFSKSEIASIVRQITTDGAGRRYYRDHLVEGRWGDSDAQVVWTFIYPSMDDHAINNPVCRGLWNNPSLPQAARPTALKGENVGDGLIVDWISYYADVARISAESKATKEEFLAAAVPLIELLDDLIQHFRKALNSLQKSQMTKAEFLERSQGHLRKAREAYSEVGDLPGAPYECSEVDNLLQQIAASVDNIPLLYSPKSSAKWTDASRLFQAIQQVEDVSNTMQDLKYELRKVR